jgi:hypothetical protein
MGQLKPGATYVYEREDGVTYCRELDADQSTRFPIGWDYNDGNNTFNNTFWSRILTEAKTNPTLQTAVDRVIMLYKLSISKYE